MKQDMTEAAQPVSDIDSGDRWIALQRTGDAVRVDPAAIAIVERRWPWRATLGAAALFAAACLGIGQLIDSAFSAHADASADSTLFSLTNQDRASNGVHALSLNSTLQAIGENARYTGCGPTIYGRSEDMVQRNYFSHQIPPCGQYVFSIMHAYGVNYQLAGENIGWVAGAGVGTASANYINGQFMNSPDHRANILEPRYTHLGVGSWSGASWSYPGGGSYANVWLFSEEFAQLGSSPPPPTHTPPPPTHRPAPRNSAAPRPPAVPPVTSTPPPAAPSTPAPTPTSTPTPTPTPVPTALLPSAVPPPLYPAYEGLLSNSIESVLESFLID
jgi:uncharacterized protein YkwD